ncbi:octapeptide-repeat protein T2-like [Solanum pennellii]|uniref:Octapeptide-repeat protein T2-like n=1 Tax=Solanum pennellii TaxID=28526 RepID=A0ABM1HE10_SOLPN|nr:octapeptide-repeat protein T2-like [Solanum pennellii]
MLPGVAATASPAARSCCCRCLAGGKRRGEGRRFRVVAGACKKNKIRGAEGKRRKEERKKKREAERGREKGKRREEGGGEWEEEQRRREEGERRERGEERDEGGARGRAHRRWWLSPERNGEKGR